MKYDSRIRKAAYLHGVEWALMGEEPEGLSGPLRNLARRIKERIQQRIANKNVSMNFGATGAPSNPTITDAAPAASTGSGMPSWAIPAAIAGVGGLVLLVALKKKGKKS